MVLDCVAKQENGVREDSAAKAGVGLILSHPVTQDGQEISMIKQVRYVLLHVCAQEMCERDLISNLWSNVGSWQDASVSTEKID